MKPLIINAGYPTERNTDLSCLIKCMEGVIRIEQTDFGEIFASFDFDASEYDVYIIGELNNHPWDQLVLFSVIAEAMKRKHAGRITLIVPVWNLTGMLSENYVGTSRTDTSRTITRLINGSGIERIVTLTPSHTLRSPFFPIEVIRPDYVGMLRTLPPFGLHNSPIIIVEDPRMFVSARELAYETSSDIAVNVYADHRANISADVDNRNVIIYTDCLSDRRILLLEDAVMKHGANSCAVFSPILGSIATASDFPGKLRSNVYTFDDTLYYSITDENIFFLPTSDIIAEWLRNDMPHFI